MTGHLRRSQSVRAVARVLAMFALLTGPSAPGWAETGPGPYLAVTGPLRIRDQFLLGLGFLAFDPVSADIVEPGKWQIDLMLTVSNDFARAEAVANVLEARARRQPLTIDELQEIASESPRGAFLVDGEHYRTAVAVRRGVREDVQLELVVPVISFQRGFLDTSVEGFHDVFSLGQMGRLGVPKDAFQVYVRSGEAELAMNDDPGVALGDVVLGAKLGLLQKAPSPSFKLAAEFLLKLPTGSEERFTGSGSTDAGVQVLVTKYVGQSCFHASFGLAYLGEMERLGLSSRAILLGMLAYERALGSRASILAQVTVSQSSLAELGLDRLKEVSMQVTLGFKRAFGKQVLLFGMTENVGHFNNSLEIGFHLGLTRMF